MCTQNEHSSCEIWLTPALLYICSGLTIKKDDVCEFICSDEMLFKVLSVLEDEDSYVRQCALEMYTTLVEYGKHPICLPI